MEAETPQKVLDVSGTYRVAPEDSVSVVYQDGNELTFVNSRWGPRKGTLSGDTIKAKVMLATLTGVFKDGVVAWSTGHVATRTGPAPEDPAEATRLDRAWFPGRHLKEGLDKLHTATMEKVAAKQHAQYEKAGNRFAAKINAMKQKRPLASRDGGCAVGTVHVSILGGHFNTARPYFVLEMDGNEERSHSAMTSNPRWGTGALPRAEFALPVYDPSSDLRLFLCDDERFDNQVPVGRVIVPIRDLCHKGLLQMPKPTHRLTFQIIPATRQWSLELEPRYEEAVPHVPGSGMARPAKDLGRVELELRLELSVPGHRPLGLLAAYAQVAPPDPWLPDDADDFDGSSSGSNAVEAKSSKGKVRMTPKVMRGNINRLTRCFHVPYLLQGPQVFALPLLLFAICFYTEAYHLPWVALGLVLLNGLLDHANRDERTKDMIFWEDSVGKDDMPHGMAKLKNLAEGLANFQEAVGKVVTLMEKQRNFVNFADGSVSLVALLCLTLLAAIASALIYLLTMRVVCFSTGLVCLLPFLARAAKGHEQRQQQQGQQQQGQQQQQQQQQQHEQHEQPDPEKAEVQKALLGKSDSRPLLRVIKMLFNVLGRVPDAKDIAHWHFCEQQVMAS